MSEKILKILEVHGVKLTENEAKIIEVELQYFIERIIADYEGCKAESEYWN